MFNMCFSKFSLISFSIPKILIIDWMNFIHELSWFTFMLFCLNQFIEIMHSAVNFLKVFVKLLLPKYNVPLSVKCVTSAFLTYPLPIPDKRKKQLKLLFSPFFADVSRRFMKASKTFKKALKICIKPFEAPQRSVKIRI